MDGRGPAPQASWEWATRDHITGLRLTAAHDAKVTTLVAHSADLERLRVDPDGVHLDGQRWVMAKRWERVGDSEA